MSKVENSVTFAESIAKDDKHGYDQIDRWGNPNYDCSGLVIASLDYAGIRAKICGATYTGNMYNALIKAGMEDVTSLVNLKTCEGMNRGDVLLTPHKHTAFYCGNKLIVDARRNENGKSTGGKSGDQTGNEIEIHDYYNYPWTYVLRYVENSTTKFYTNEEVAEQVLAGKWGNGEERKSKLTSAGYSYDAIQKIVNEKTAGTYVANKTLEEVAQEVILGKWGNGEERKKRLEDADMNFEQVQAMVNKLLNK